MISRSLPAALLGAALHLSLPFNTLEAALLLAEKGHTDYVIVLVDDAIPAERTAAQQLQNYLEQATGAEFPVVAASEVPKGKKRIIIGRGKASEALVPEEQWKAVGQDGILIHSNDADLVLAGDRPRGTLYAVFEFLEQQVGVRWWAPDAYHVPKREKLDIPTQSYVFTPPFSYREHYTHAVSRPNNDMFFGTVMRENGHYQTQDEAWGGHYHIIGFVHTFSNLIPSTRYFKDHPEWFADPANKGVPCTADSVMPTGDSYQLCFSAPGLLEEATKNALDWISKNPTAGYISLSESDFGPYCQCAGCREFAQREGSEAGPILDFVNKIAAKIHEQYPDFLVETLAYHGSEKPPKTIKPAKNVIIRMAPIDTDYGYPTDSERNKAVRDNLLQWSRIAHHLFIWGYETNFTYVLMPHPNWRNIANDLRFYAANNVKGFYQQGNRYSNGAGDFVELRTYLNGKLLWNPSLDQAGITRDFLLGYYGPKAGPILAEYIDLVLASYEKEHKPLGCFNPDFSYLTLDVMNKATRLFDAAEAAVEGDPVLLHRISRSRVSIEFAWLQCYRALRAEADRRNAEFLGPKSLPEGLDAFRKLAARHGIERSGENYTVEARLKLIAEPQKK